MSAPKAIKVRVPASTANLGPGFDCLGLALNLYNDFEAKPSTTGKDRIVGSGICEGLDEGSKNVFFKAFAQVYKSVDQKPPKIEVSVKGRIPMARGLGSSSTAIVAGALTANAVLGSPFSPEDLLLPVTIAEGHPDNVAPALLGGLTASMFDGKRVITHGYPPDPKWRVAVLIPDYKLLTEDARNAIPATIPHADAVANLSRMPLLVDALMQGDAEELGFVIGDKLHEPYRKKLIKRHDAIKKAAMEAGAAAVYLSGAGPTMAAFCLGAKTAKAVAEAMAQAVETARFTAKAKVLKPELEGAQVRIV